MRIQTLSLSSPVDSILVVSVDALEARLIVHCEGLQLYLGQLLWPAGGHGGTHVVHGGQVLDITYIRLRLCIETHFFVEFLHI